MAEIPIVEFRTCIIEKKNTKPLGKLIENFGLLINNKPKLSIRPIIKRIFIIN